MSIPLFLLSLSLHGKKYLSVQRPVAKFVSQRLAKLVTSTSRLFFERVAIDKRFSHLYIAFKMSRKSFKEINPFEQTQTIPSEEQERPFEWSLCILCQKLTKESLQCPVRSKRLDLGAGYKSMAENLQGFFAIGALPFDVKQNKLDDGSGLFNTLSKHEAPWHKSCKDKINSTKLKRA